MIPTVQVRVKKGRERPLLLGHPWVFSGAVEAWSSTPAPGAPADVLDHAGTWLARGLAHPEAGLSVRLYTRDPDQPLDEAFFRARIESAVALRRSLAGAAGPGTNAWRLVFSESDGLSGLVADRFGDLLAVRVGARGLAPFLPAIVDQLRTSAGIERAWVSAEKDAAEREGLGAAELQGLSTTADATTEILESGHRFRVDAAAGQKTGFYLDQRENRRRVAAYARGRRMLSCYCYTGAFEVHAAAAGAASVTGLDESSAALAAAREHLAMNAPATPAEYIAADVPHALRRYRDARASFDLIVLDPPRFVHTAAQREKGLRAYKDNNLLAIKLLAPGGILATFSCSGLVSPDDLRTALRWAAQDAGRRVRLLETLSQPFDHPRLISFPESEYLAGFIATADG
jgi:23S rRNA (cytosine1962-C5)-methyltransferase